jgi:hypothetical protein
MVKRLIRISLLVLAVFCLIGVVVGALVYFNQKTIAEKLQKIAGEKLHGKLEVGDVRFRPLSNGLGLTFSFRDVRLTDSLFHRHKIYTLKSSAINVSLNFSSLLSREVAVEELVLEDGEANVFVQKDGYSNSSIFGKDSDARADEQRGKGKGFKELNTIKLKNVAVQYSDSVKEKSYGVVFRHVNLHVAKKDSLWTVAMHGPVFWRGLVFNPSKGGFLVNSETNINFDLVYDSGEKQLKINPSNLWVPGGNKIELGGVVTMKEHPRSLDLNFKTEDIKVEQVLTLLPAKLGKAIRRIKILPKVSAEANIVGRMGQGSPVVNVGFVTDTFRYELPIGMLKGMKATGSFTNQADPTLPIGDENSRITGKGITGFFETFPVKGEITVTDFSNPQTIIDCSLKADPASANALFDQSRYRIKSGRLHLDFHYTGSLTKFYNKELDRLNGEMLGQATFSDVALTYLPQKVNLSKLNGRVNFTEKDFLLPGITFTDGQNRMRVTGRADGLIPYLFGSPKQVKAFVHLNIPTWELNWVETILNYNKREEVVEKRSNFKVSKLMDQVIDNMDIEASLESNRLQYKRLTATRVRGKFTLTQKGIEVHTIAMNTCGGSVNVSGGIRNVGAKELPFFYAKGKLENTDVHKVFYSLDNFGQQAMTDKNLSGKLNAAFEFETRLKQDVQLIPSTMKGNLKVELKEARIVNFEPFLKIKKLIFKKRPMEDVRFATIANEFKLDGEEVTVKNMEIESNIMTFFVEGIYSFGNKTDLSIQIPMSNLKSRDSTYQLGARDRDSTKGRSIYLRARDNDSGEVNFKLALRRPDLDRKKGSED